MWQPFECCGKKIIGKPCEGEPHARFEVAGDGNGSYRASGRRAGNKKRKWNNRRLFKKIWILSSLVTYIQIMITLA